MQQNKARENAKSDVDDVDEDDVRAFYDFDQAKPSQTDQLEIHINQSTRIRNIGSDREQKASSVFTINHNIHALY